MRARADKIAAGFDVRSRPSAGTTIEVTVPNAVVEAAGPATSAE
jgi:hypothetical protein